MKHKTIWIFIIWMLVVSLFELPLTWKSVENVLMISLMEGYGSLIFIVICDLYVIASLTALAIANFIIEKVDNMNEGIE